MGLKERKSIASEKTEESLERFLRNKRGEGKGK